MTTNSPNPVDGDVQALIKHIRDNLAQFESDSYKFPNTEMVYRIALAALTAPPSKLLRPVELPDDFSDIRIKKAKLWIERVMLDKPGMKEAKTCAAILEFVAEVQRLNATAQPVSDGWIFEACENEPCPNGAVVNVIGADIHLCSVCAGDKKYSRIKITALPKRLSLPTAAAAPGGQDD